MIDDKERQEAGDSSADQSQSGQAPTEPPSDPNPAQEDEVKGYGEPPDASGGGK